MRSKRTRNHTTLALSVNDETSSSINMLRDTKSSQEVGFAFMTNSTHQVMQDDSILVVAGSLLILRSIVETVVPLEIHTIASDI